MNASKINLTLGDAQRPFLFRKGTGDEVIIARVLQDNAFNFGRLRHAAELSSLYQRLVQTGKAPLIVDTKANFGASAVYFAYSFAKARVIAIEPARSNFDLLAVNTEGLRVECLRAAVTASATDFSGATLGAEFPGIQSISSGGGINLAPPVPSLTINEIYERNKQDTLPFIVKVDIEANGAALFAANTEWISRTPVIVIVLHDGLIPGTANSRTFIEHVANFNRDFVYLNDSVFSIDRNLIASDFDVP
jgi:FkbM family methyltransferase